MPGGTFGVPSISDLASDLKVCYSLSCPKGTGLSFHSSCLFMGFCESLSFSKFRKKSVSFSNTKLKRKNGWQLYCSIPLLRVCLYSFVSLLQICQIWMFPINMYSQTGINPGLKSFLFSRILHSKLKSINLNKECTVVN